MCIAWRQEYESTLSWEIHKAAKYPCLSLSHVHTVPATQTFSKHASRSKRRSNDGGGKNPEWISQCERRYFGVFVCARVCRCEALCVCVRELLLPLRAVGRYLPALPVQTPNSWKQTLTTGALFLGVEGESKEGGEAWILWCCSSPRCDWRCCFTVLYPVQSDRCFFIFLLSGHLQPWLINPEVKSELQLWGVDGERGNRVKQSVWRQNWYFTQTS